MCLQQALTYEAASLDILREESRLLGINEIRHDSKHGHENNEGVERIKWSWTYNYNCDNPYLILIKSY